MFTLISLFNDQQNNQFYNSGIIKINTRDLDEFVKSKTLKSYLLSPLEKAQLLQKVDLKITVSGGGQSGQVGSGSGSAEKCECLRCENKEG